MVVANGNAVKIQQNRIQGKVIGMYDFELCFVKK